MGLRGFLRFAAGRLVAFVVLAVGVTLISFVVTNLVPGDPVAAALPDLALYDQEIVGAYREKYGLGTNTPRTHSSFATAFLPWMWLPICAMALSSTTRNR